jgi:hexosaminidase
MKVDVKLEGKTIKTISTSDSFALDKSGTYEFKGLKNGKEGKAYVVTLDAHKGTTASIKLTNPPADQYKGNGPSSVINGITGSSEKFSGVEWLGFEGKDFEADLSWKNEMDLNEVQLRFFKGEGQWIYLPKSVDVSVSTDGSNYKPVQTINDVGSDQKIAALNVNLGGIKAKHLKIKAANFGIIPDGLQGGGHGAWLFVDEIVVK